MSERLSPNELAQIFLEEYAPNLYSRAKELGFAVLRYPEEEYGSLVRVFTNQPSYCGDGRREVGKPKADRSNKFFGGIFMAAVAWAEVGGVITSSSIHNARYHGVRNSIRLGAHDIDHTDWSHVHCGMAKLLSDGSLPYHIDYNLLPRDVIGMLGTDDIVELEGEHVETGWIVNFRPGFTRVPDGRLFATDTRGLQLAVGQHNVDMALALSADVVNILKPDANIIYVAY